MAAYFKPQTMAFWNWYYHQLVGRAASDADETPRSLGTRVNVRVTVLLVGLLAGAPYGRLCVKTATFKMV